MVRQYMVRTWCSEFSYRCTASVRCYRPLLGLIRRSWTPSERRLRCLTSPQKLDSCQVEDFAFLSPSILTERANSIGVRLPIEPWGRFSL